MKYLSRRSFFKQGVSGLAALGAGGLVLGSDRAPTEANGELGDTLVELGHFDIILAPGAALV